MGNPGVKDQILEAAGPVFASRGFRGATVREICAAADVNVAAINYYFGDKLQLYVETVRRAHQLRAQEIPMPAWSADATADEKMHGFVRTILERMIGKQGARWPSELMTREVLRPTEACRSLVKDYFRPTVDLLLEIIDEMVPAATSQHCRQQLAFSVIGQCFFYRVSGDVIPMMIGKKAMKDHYSVDALAALIAGLVCAALRQSPETWHDHLKNPTLKPL